MIIQPTAHRYDALRNEWEVWLHRGTITDETLRGMLRDGNAGQCVDAPANIGDPVTVYPAPPINVRRHDNTDRPHSYHDRPPSEFRYYGSWR